MKKILVGAPFLTILSVCISLIVTPVQADDLTVFSNGKVADANEVNANFNELETRIKTISLTPGETGAVGAQGIQGSQGFTGATGDTGARGIQGLSGDAGTNGRNGTNGAAGGKGATGDAGAAGQNGADGVMYDGAFEGDMQYWNGNAWIMITAPAENAGSLSFCDGQPTWTQGECPVYYAVGDVGPAGGWVFHITDGGLHGLEAAPEDIPGGRIFMWGCMGEEVLGASGVAIGTGATNTEAIAAHECTITPRYGIPTHEAALSANDYTFNGYTDWFLPSLQEFKSLYATIRNELVSNAWYTTSSQGGDHLGWHHWAVYTNNGHSRVIGKAMQHNVRAVRAF
jgi:hypothetical protein